MYERFFGLADAPFRLTPDPRYLFLSSKHADAIAHLRLGLEESSGFVCITGDVGTGKTTLLRAFLTGLGPEVATAYIFNPALTALELLQTINAELGLPASSTSQKALVDALNVHLLAQREAGRRSIVVIDEAQNLSVDVLEQLRLLSNLETTTEKLLRIVLVGQPQLRTLLLHPELIQLNQRITLRWHMGPLAYKETIAYIRHRLQIASGGEEVPELVSSGATRLIHRYAGGVPRLINMIAHRAMLAAFAADESVVGTRAVRQAYREIGALPLARSHPPRRRLWVGAAAAAAVAGLAFGAWRLWPPDLRIALLRRPEAPLATNAPAPSPPAPAPDDVDRQPGTDAQAGVGATATGPDTTVAAAPPDDAPAPIAAAEAPSPEPPPAVPDTPPPPPPIVEPPVADAPPDPTPAEVAAAPAPEPTPPPAEAPPPEPPAEVAKIEPPAPPSDAPVPAPADTPSTEASEAMPIVPVAEATSRLSDLDRVASAKSAIQSLLGTWRVRPLEPSESGAIVDLTGIAQRRGLDHLPIVGNVSMLRLLDLPAILELRLPETNGPRYVTLTELGLDTSVLTIDGTPTRVPAGFIDRHWFGQAYVLWRDFDSLGRTFGREASGPPVARLQDLLRRVGLYDGPANGHFDAATSAAVLEFQRSRFLQVDGRIGRLTRIVLYAAAGGYPRPTISAPPGAPS
jgi:general secretion pathway protein A